MQTKKYLLSKTLSNFTGNYLVVISITESTTLQCQTVNNRIVNNAKVCLQLLLQYYSTKLANKISRRLLENLITIYHWILMTMNTGVVILIKSHPNIIMQLYFLL